MKAGSRRESHWACCTLAIMDAIGGFRWHMPLLARSSGSLTDISPCLPDITLPHSSGAEGCRGTGRDVRVVLCIQFVFNSVLERRERGQTTMCLKGLAGAKSKSQAVTTSVAGPPPVPAAITGDPARTGARTLIL